MLREEKIIREELAKIANPKTKQQVAERLQKIENKERDLYFLESDKTL